MVPSILYLLVGTCSTLSWPPERLRVEKVGRPALPEVDRQELVPPYNSEQGLIRTFKLYNKVQEAVEDVLYDYPLRSPSFDNQGGCYYHHAENSPDFESSQSISLLPPDFYSPRSTAAFLETLRDGSSSSSFHTPVVPEDVDPELIIPDGIAKNLLLMLVQDFVPIYSLDCSNVTTLPLPFTDEAKTLAGVNIQAFTEELKKFPLQMFLVSWWLPSLSWYLPPGGGSAAIEVILRHNSLVANHHLHVMNDNIKRNQEDVKRLRKEFLRNGPSVSPAPGIGTYPSNNSLERFNTLIEEHRFSSHGPLETLTRNIDFRTSMLEEGLSEII
jgi:hypothetical protein